MFSEGQTYFASSRIVECIILYNNTLKALDWNLWLVNIDYYINYVCKYTAWDCTFFTFLKLCSYNIV